MPQLAWIGLGNMGRGMSRNIITKGNLNAPLIIYNRTTQRATDLAAEYSSDAVVVSESVEDAVSKSDIIFFCLGDDNAIRAAVRTAIGKDVRGKLLVDCSTVHPDTTTELETMVMGAGAEFVACPVFGAPAMADAGQLICVLAGPAASVDKVKPYTQGVIARANIDFSDQAPSKACLLKLVGNTMICNMVESLAEGHVLAEKSGLGVENLQQFIGSLFPGPYLAYSKRMSSGDYVRDEPLFAVDLALKDVGHALHLADRSGVEMKALRVAQEHLQAVKKHEGAKGDLPGIYGAVRGESGLAYK